MSLFFFDCRKILTVKSLQPMRILAGQIGKRAFAVGEEAYYWSILPATAVCYLRKWFSEWLKMDLSLKMSFWSGLWANDYDLCNPKWIDDLFGDETRWNLKAGSNEQKKFSNMFFHHGWRQKAFTMFMNHVQVIHAILSRKGKYQTIL